ncbi:tRNA lysidine(34) synthetase TilS [Lentibacillus lipolyticus]|nr:tRNA lysidine(34) synthetase TilS [Lentibacillus lipolyticus]
MKENDLLTPGMTVLVGVSGGPDSMALLHFLWRLRETWDLRIVAVTADHQLRGDASREDLSYVKRVCRDWEIEFSGTSLDVASYKQTEKAGTQAAARHMRYAFFEKEMERFQADRLALGHHGDDQAETMLMGLVHSASIQSLTGIPVQRSFATGHIVRPFLCVTKKDIESYCREWGITPRRDPSNHDDTYTRNYYRNHVLPLMKEKNSNLHKTMQHLSESLQDDQAFLKAEARKMVEKIAEIDDKRQSVSFSIFDFLAYPRSLQRRFFHLILNYLYREQPVTLSYIHEKQFFSLLTGEEGNTRLDFPQQLKVERNYRTVLFYFMNEQSQPYYYMLEVPGELVLPNGHRLTADYTDDPVLNAGTVFACRAENVALPLHIRTRQAGDRMSWSGLNGSKKLKDVFIDAKIPLNERDTWPVIADNNGNILWLAGLKKGFPAGNSKEGPFIQITYEKREQ